MYSDTIKDAVERAAAGKAQELATLTTIEVMELATAAVAVLTARAGPSAVISMLRAIADDFEAHIGRN